MIRFDIHSVDSAPQDSRPLLKGLKEKLGMIPNLAASMAESPELLKGFLRIREAFYGGTFTPGEVQVLALTNAFENGCRYCMALHSAFALKEGVTPAAVDALRLGRAPEEPKLRALSDFSRTLVRTRGNVRPDDVSAFVAAGYIKAQALEVVLGVAVSILPNFAHHVTQCPIDEAFQSHQWNDARR